MLFFSEAVHGKQQYLRANLIKCDVLWNRLSGKYRLVGNSGCKGMLKDVTNMSVSREGN